MEKRGERGRSNSFPEHRQEESLSSGRLMANVAGPVVIQPLAPLEEAVRVNMRRRAAAGAG